jgi:hypothetical protein
MGAAHTGLSRFDKALVHGIELAALPGSLEPRLDDRQQIGLGNRPGRTKGAEIAGARHHRHGGKPERGKQDRGGAGAHHRMGVPMPINRSRQTKPIAA